MTNISDRQLALLCDLAALEAEGLINGGYDAQVTHGYDAGTQEVEVPGTLTHLGGKMVSEFKLSGRTVFP